MQKADQSSVSSRTSGGRRTAASVRMTPQQLRHTGVVIGIIGLSVFGGFSGAWLQDRQSSTAVVGGEKKIVSSESRLITQIAKTVGPSVVSVNQAEGAGTGVIISAKGIIMTNRHVIPEGSTDFSVTLSDGTELKDVSLIGRTNENDSLDIAFLKINNREGHTLIPAKLGDSATVRVGDDVVAIGNALGQFQNTVTSGIISGYGRSVQAGGDRYDDSVESLDNLFQTDAAINEGNSGGPLTNLNGQVIGINTAVASNSQNIGFAIPINDIRGLIAQVLETGTFARPYLGVRYVSLSPDSAKQLGTTRTQGAFIVPSDDPENSPIIAGSPAAKAGLRAGDIIVSVNGTTVDQAHALGNILARQRVGDKVLLKVDRDGKTITIRAVLGSLPTTQ